MCYEFHTQIVKFYIKPYTVLPIDSWLKIKHTSTKAWGQAYKSDEHEFCKI